MIDFKDRHVRYGVVLAMIAAVTGLRIIDSETGPLYLIPIVVAGLWLGHWQGFATGLLAAVLFRVTIDLSGDGASDPSLAGELMRGVVYAGLGWLIGRLSESRIALERELTRRELELEELRTLQAALAPPEPPKRPRLELATCYIAAEQGVSGDFYVVVPTKGDSTLIAVGDVAGRGLEAAKRAWYVRTLIASSAEITVDPAETLERANSGLIADAGFDSPFVTAACVVFHPDGEIEWALAGHDGPMRLDSADRLSGEGRSGLPLGVSDELGCQTSRAKLMHGEGLILYTDGLTEARRRTDRTATGFELYGEDRIASVLASASGVPGADVLERVRDDVREFSGGELGDDLCMVTLRLESVGDATEVCSPERAEMANAE